MLGNLINIHDFSRLAEKLKRGQLRQILSSIFSSKEKKIKQIWKDAEQPPTDWLSLPLVKQRWNYLVSGDTNVDYCEYISQKYLSVRTPLVALSLGCGSGDRELTWAKLGIFQRIDAYDLSEARIEYAKKKASETGLGHIVNYSFGDAYSIDPGHSSYDVILVEHSLHHFSPLDKMLMRINESLKPNGYFIVNEFVGPTRFQWTDTQLQVVNGLLSILPAKYRTVWQSELTKSRIFRPGRLSMVLRDPSEAAESSRILPLLNRIFDIIEVKGCAGTILHLLLADIAQNFSLEDNEAQRFLRVCIKVEDLLLEGEHLTSDFVVAICKKRGCRDAP